MSNKNTKVIEDTNNIIILTQTNNNINTNKTKLWMYYENIKLPKKRKTTYQVYNILNKNRYSSSSVICRTTGPKPLPKRFLHIVRSRAPSFN